MRLMLSGVPCLGGSRATTVKPRLAPPRHGKRQVTGAAACFRRAGCRFAAVARERRKHGTQRVSPALVRRAQTKRDSTMKYVAAMAVAGILVGAARAEQPTAQIVLLLKIY